MKKIIFIIVLLVNLIANAQEDKTVTLVVTGQGKTLEEAKQNALRSAIEQAFGTFISSKSEILNDNLVKDEIVSVANGNIQKFEIISEIQIPEVGYATSLKATVSVTKLTSFVESKGVVVEFKGSLFAFNATQQILNEQNEVTAIKNLREIVKNMTKNSFDYYIKASEPESINGSSDRFSIPLEISVVANENLLNIFNIIYNTLKGLSLSIEEAENYKSIKKSIYPITIGLTEEVIKRNRTKKEASQIILRKVESVSDLLIMIYSFSGAIMDFKISNGIADIKIQPTDFYIGNNYTEIARNKQVILLDNFKIILNHEGNFPQIYRPTSLLLQNRYSRSFKKRGNYHGAEIYYDKNYYEFLEDYVKSNLPSYSPSLTRRGYYDNYGIQNSVTHRNFTFVNDLFEEGEKKFRPERPNDSFKFEPGIIISFIGIKPNQELYKIKYIDERNIDDLKKIKEYKVTPLKRFE